MKYKKIPHRVVKAFDNYGEKLGYELPTLSSLIKDAVEASPPDPDEVREILEDNEGRLDITDDLLLCATGYTALGLIENAEDEQVPVGEYIAEEIDSDGNCPFKETKSAWEYFAQDGDNWNVQREIANEVFVAMFGQSAEDMLVSIAQAINEKLPAPEGKKAENRTEEPTL